jgi:hypothetical protein
VDPNTRQAKRAPVTLKIKFKSATIDQFIERYAADVSRWRSGRRCASSSSSAMRRR